MYGLAILLIFILVVLIAIYYSDNTVQIVDSEEAIQIGEDHLSHHIDLGQYKVFNMSVRRNKDGFRGLIRVIDPDDFSYPYQIQFYPDGQLKSLHRIEFDYSQLSHCISEYKGVHSNGLEDPRIFTYRGEDWCISNCLGSLRQPHPCVNSMSIFKLSDPEATFRILTPPEDIDPMQHQKNWSPFEWNHRLMCEYSLYPRLIVEIDVDTGLATRLAHQSVDDMTIRNPMSLRGGAPPILIQLNGESYYLGIGHTRHLGRSDYVQFFYLFQSQPPFNIISTSSNFKLDGSERIQFATGLSAYQNDFYVSYGVDDNTNRISKFTFDHVMSMF